MTFQYTDEQLNLLNQGQNVYSVNKGFVKRHQGRNSSLQLIVGKDTKDLLPNETNTISLESGQQFKVIKTYSDPRTGLNVNKRAKTAVIRSHRCLRSFLLLKSLWEHELPGEVMS